jgi:ABC-type histidine transport system ATPase subunit
MSEKLLEVKGLHVNYGAIEAIKGIDLYVNKGELFKKRIENSDFISFKENNFR